jgi:hypothetical protein
MDMNPATPWIEYMPTWKDGVAANLAWRVRMREAAEHDPQLQYCLYNAAMQDVLFFFNAFGWLMNPRAKEKVLPFCIAAGTLVVTDRGSVPIEKVTKDDLVWDGDSWISQGGALYKGHMSVMLAYGVYLTKDHRVYTDHGWKMASEGYDRASVRLPDGYRARWGLSPENGASREVDLSMSMRKEGRSGWRPDAERQNNELRMSEGGSCSRTHERQKTNSDLLHLVRDVATMHQSEQSNVASLRWSRNQSVQAVAAIRELPEGHGGEAIGIDARSDRSRRRLQASQLPMGDMERTEKQSVVYDLINCGGRRAFAVLGNDGRQLLVHNCTWPHQDPVILAMDQAIHDAEASDTPIALTLPKSRAQGATFAYINVLMRRFLRDPMFSAGLVTRNEKLVDSATDQNTILWKVDWGLKMLPWWFLPLGYERSLSDHTIWNPAQNSIFTGFAATSDVGRGGRQTVFALDEFGSEEFIASGKDYKVLSSISHVTNCLAGGTLVVTDHGPIPIEDVQLHHRVWDGRMWVSHDGCIFQGWRETIRSYRIRLTPDHQVLTKEGWKYAKATKGIDRAEIRLPPGYSERWLCSARPCKVDLPMRLWGEAIGDRDESHQRANEKLRLSADGCGQTCTFHTRHEQNSELPHVGGYVAEMHKPTEFSVPILRWSRNSGMREMAEVRQLLVRYGREARWLDAGSDKQRLGILQGKLPMGDDAAAVEQQTRQPYHRDFSSESHAGSDCQDGWGDTWSDFGSHQEGLFDGCSIASTQKSAAVYDLLNCGPRRAFTVLDDGGRPLLSHNCMFLVSTYGGDAGAFYEAATDEENPLKVVLDWKDNPAQTRNAYVWRDGKLVAVRPEEQAAVDRYARRHASDLRKLERRGHKLDGKFRSPWYDAYCLLPGATPRWIARELDMNAHGVTGKPFDKDVLEVMLREKVKPPVWEGRARLEDGELKLTPQAGGPLKLWFKPGLNNAAPGGKFTLGADIGTGEGEASRSNSVLIGCRNKNGEQVLEYTDPQIAPRPFAQLCVAFGRWLHDAVLNWERQGPGGSFGAEVRKGQFYPHVWIKPLKEGSFSQDRQRDAGWNNNSRGAKADLFGDLSFAFAEGTFLPRSEDFIKECAGWQWDEKVQDGMLYHGTGHGDRAIAGGVCWTALKDFQQVGVDKREPEEQSTKYGTMAYRLQQRQQKASGAEENDFVGFGRTTAGAW